MSDWIWAPPVALYVVHDRQIVRHGGALWTRDPVSLERGYTRTINRVSYEDADVCAIATAHVYSIAKAHAFVDGNKLTTFVALLPFCD